MRLLSLLTAIFVLGLSLASGNADAAKRLGGGQSSGMQRQATPSSPAAAPGQAGKGQAAAPAAQPKRSWMGPLAGLAAGLGLAALASYFGFAEELATAMLIGLMVVAALAVVGFIMRKRALARQGDAGGMQYAGAAAGAGSASGRGAYDMVMPGSSTPAPAALASESAPTSGNIPADFDKAGFERNAKVNFIRLQAANDAGDVEDIRNFTTPEMFAELRMQITERGAAAQKTDVVSINASVVDVSEEDGRYVVSVRFAGVLREAPNEPAQSVDEVWHMVKPRDGSSGWLLAGIQQVS